MKGLKNRALRGVVMVALRENGEIGDHLIKILVEKTPYEASLEDIKKQMGYLEDKGYIRAEKVSIKEIGASRMIAKLTFKGQDLLDGTIPPDEGVVMPDE